MSNKQKVVTITKEQYDSIQPRIIAIVESIIHDNLYRIDLDRRGGYSPLYERYLDPTIKWHNEIITATLESVKLMRM